MKWLPWRFAIRYVARKQGFLDPIALLARLHGFAQPSEVGEPIELLRAGVVFHARGLINSRVIQHNLDWVWPYWIERQFDPRDPSFVPRAFSITHINLSHRNWTAVGHPDCEELPIVDPRGLVTPIYDGWSLDGWILRDDGTSLLPCRATESRQEQTFERGTSVVTDTRYEGMSLRSESWVELEGGMPVCRIRLTGSSDRDASLVLSLRPSNPEGIAFVHDVELNRDRTVWTVNDEHEVRFSQPAERHHVSDYHNGDVYIHLHDLDDQQTGHCEVGMVTAAALFELKAGEPRELTATIPLPPDHTKGLDADAWSRLRNQACVLECPEPQYQFLYDAAVTSLILHSPKDVYPGPYTYKRFWFRDAAYIIHALLCVGLTERAERALDQFPDRQTALGYFRSQEGEWDSNGEVLWILKRYFDLTDHPPHAWHNLIEKGARWILRKRLKDDLDAPHAGLMPAGFSAEHLGPNDYYYWDDFWSVAGLHAATRMMSEQTDRHGRDFETGARDFERAIERSLEQCQARLGRPGMPASPYRRLDAGAIGSLAVGYPLQLWRPDDPRLLDCVEFLLERCFVKGAFYQDMIHSGLNAYLTLHVAQVLLRAGDPRYLELMDAVADLASPTGQWPEAIHPLTEGGCMGDGHHVWASAEWVLMIRNLFVREEGDELRLCEGVPRRWLEKNQPIRFGPAPTPYGALSLAILPEDGGGWRLEWRGDWRREWPPMTVCLPGFKTRSLDQAEGSVTLEPEDG
ncbi:hypothetical protein [Saccharospirillum salsuginis]|uniref:Glucoamylase (Glucan-1,4-alpha-glucosidase), GH15 family n=1 Tax=Saccharospirillum salsuginis TaxID=418750 RepID=A0A918NDX7_9GAMM|nr:hypothetical protein [Saccharospirillum salsuginis]GGX63220.1 hypothetical protein GCM10007392_33890 [Saccharospirillum salsuginis]